MEFQSLSFNNPTNPAHPASPNIELIHKSITSISKGVLSKGWYKVGNKMCMVKGNTEGHMEPFGEYIGSNLANKMVGDIVIPQYICTSSLFPDITTYNFNYVSICERWHSRNTMQFSKYVDMALGQPPMEYFSWIANRSSDEFKSQVVKMFVVDAILGNSDRHLNNFDVDLDTGLIPAIIDFGGGCLTQGYTYLSSESLEPNKSRPFKFDHIQQLYLMGSLGIKVRINNPISIIEEIFPLLANKILSMTGEYKEYLDILYDYLMFRAPVMLEIAKDYVEVI